MSKPSKSSYKTRYQELNEEPIDSWTTSYGDLMTILLVFFVMLISMTQVSAVKFERLKHAFNGSSQEQDISLVLQALQEEIAEHNLSNQVKVVSNDKSIEISFRDRLLFDLGASKVKPEGAALLKTFSERLAQLPDYAHIAIEGYTDDNPVNRHVYESNWHLSALRSLSVLQLLETYEVCRENCELRGYGEYRPAVPNRDEMGQPIAKNQSENRRVVLRIF